MAWTDFNESLDWGGVEELRTKEFLFIGKNEERGTGNEESSLELFGLFFVVFVDDGGLGLHNEHRESLLGADACFSGFND